MFLRSGAKRGRPKPRSRRTMSGWGIGLDRSVAPQASLALNFASVAGALLFGVVVDRFGAGWPRRLAYGALIAALFALGAATELKKILLFSAATGFFLMGANYSPYGVAASYYPRDVRGTGFGASIAVGRVGPDAGRVSARYGHDLGARSAAPRAGCGRGLHRGVRTRLQLARRLSRCMTISIPLSRFVAAANRAI